MSARSSLAAKATVVSSKLPKASITVQVFIHFMAVLLPYICPPPKLLQPMERQKPCQPLRSPGRVNHTRYSRAWRGSIQQEKRGTLQIPVDTFSATPGGVRMAIES